MWLKAAVSDLFFMKITVKQFYFPLVITYHVLHGRDVYCLLINQWIIKLIVSRYVHVFSVIM